MKLRVLSVGRRVPGWAEDGVAEFARRFTRQFPVELEAVDAAPRTAGASTEQLQHADSERLLSRVRPGERLVALDERGRELSSRQLADRIEAWQHDGRDVVLVIGGADGHSDALKTRADELISLSRMTLPHAMARLMLIEQLYRAWTLLSGHPYHRD